MSKNKYFRQIDVFRGGVLTVTNFGCEVLVKEIAYRRHDKRRAEFLWSLVFTANGVCFVVTKALIAAKLLRITEAMHHVSLSRRRDEGRCPGSTKETHPVAFRPTYVQGGMSESFDQL